MIQICRLWNLSIASVLALTVSNVLLTVRLLHNADCPYSDTEEMVSVLPRAPPLTAQPCIEYVISEQTNQSDRPVFSNLNLNLGRWDAHRMYKYFDFAIIGERFIELSEEYTVCLLSLIHI